MIAFLGPLMAVWRLIGVKGLLIILGALAALYAVTEFADTYFDRGVEAQKAKVEKANETTQDAFLEGVRTVEACQAKWPHYRWDASKPAGRRCVLNTEVEP